MEADQRTARIKLHLKTIGQLCGCMAVLEQARELAKVNVSRTSGAMYNGVPLIEVRTIVLQDMALAKPI
jgi:hypothetical protein